MKCLYITIVMVFIFGAGIVAAEEGPKNGSAAAQGTAVQSQEKEIVTDLNDRRSNDKEHGVSSEREMPEGQTYDENTGLPNVVPSDKEGEM